MEPVVHIDHLTFTYEGARRPALCDLCLELQRGERWLIVGANGAGKTTLLRVLAGQHMVPAKVARILGRSAFHDCSLVEQVRFVGGPFPFDADITVRQILANRPTGDAARRQRLLEVLDIDDTWHMHAVSDGQRRRVHLLLHLEKPRDLLLLDEVTTDLDVVARADLLALLRDDGVTYGTTILYATHIFDGLEEFATHVLVLEDGKVALACPLEELDELTELHGQRVHSPLYRLVERWIRFGCRRR